MNPSLFRRLVVAHLRAESVRDIALPYADRPGYKEEWRP